MLSEPRVEPGSQELTHTDMVTAARPLASSSMTSISNIVRAQHAMDCKAALSKFYPVCARWNIRG
jgi:hypothetical protein